MIKSLIETDLQRGGNMKPTSTRRILVVAAVLAVTLVNCGRDDPDDMTGSDAQATSPTSATAGPDPPDDGGADNGTDDSDPNGKDSEGKGELAWVPFGPTSPIIPDDERWYGQLVDHRCSDVGRDSGGSAGRKELLYQGLGKACSALFDNQTQRWDDAQRDLARGLDQLAGEDLKCHDLAAVALAKRLLEYPRRPPRVKIAATPGTVCEWQIEQIYPSEGPLEGKTVVEIEGSGDGLYTVTEVLFGGVPAEIQSHDPEDDSIEVVAPSMASPGEVQITVRGRAGSRTSDVRFEYLADSEESDGNTDDGDSDEPPPPEDDPTATPSEPVEGTG